MINSQIDVVTYKQIKRPDKMTNLKTKTRSAKQIKRLKALIRI